MKGTVVATWVQTSRELFGDDVVDRALKANGLEVDRIFTPLEDVNDEVAKGIVETIGTGVGKSPAEIWMIIGNENIKTFFKNYPGFFRHHSAYHFLRSMNDVHAIVVKRIKGSVPPRLDLLPVSSNQVMFVYKSKRMLGDYLSGLLKGVSDYFNEEIKIEQISRSEDEIKLKLTFEKKVQYVKKYPLSIILSFGFIKDVALKVSIFSTIIVTLVSLFTGQSPLQLGITAFAVFAASFIGTKIINLPRKVIKDQINEMVDGNFSEMVQLYTNDDYHETMEEVNRVKMSVQKDFIGFNAIVDEMYTFNHSVSEIAKTMERASNDIINVLDEVAKAATTQAEDTERGITILNDSVKNITVVSDESQDNKDRITEVVDGIEDSFGNVESTAVEINQVLNQFSEIRKSGIALNSNAEKINDIVLLVSAIASQINLLSLNASIEAARAGESGRGFAVVAEEVKKLSEETNSAVGQISDSLIAFRKNISEVVGQIDIQYEVLEKENSKLNSAVGTSGKSNDDLKVVSDLMIQTSLRLKEEAQHISELYGGIESLAAIAEENSAATEEASSNVAIYVDQISELTTQIEVFKQMIQNFQEDLAKYKV